MGEEFGGRLEDHTESVYRYSGDGEVDDDDDEFTSILKLWMSPSR